MAQLDVVAPHFGDRITEAQRLVASNDRTPGLEDSDRELLSRTLRNCTCRIEERCSPEQLLHGEPHPGNLLGRGKEILFIDLETGCRGPVEFDIAHVPEQASEHYADADHKLVRECRGLILAMVAAWRSQRDDHDPGGRRAGMKFLSALREGPPWPTLDVIT